MTDIRRLLRGAADDRSLRPISTDPLPQLNRAARRRRAGAALTSVTLAIGAAVLLLLILPGGSKSHIKTYSDSPPAGASFGVGQSLTYGDGSIWSLDADGAMGMVVVHRIDARSGAVVGSYRPGVLADHIAFGAGRVWTYDGSPNGFADDVSAFNPANRQIRTVTISDPRGAPGGIAFAHDSAFLIQPTLDKVLRIFLDRATLRQESIKIFGSPTWIASTRDGLVWVENVRGQLSELRPTDGVAITTPWSASVGANWSGGILATAGNNSVWSSIPGNGFRLFDPATLTADDPFEGPLELSNGRLLQLAPLSGGVCIATTRGVEFYSSQALATTRTPSRTLAQPIPSVGTGGPGSIVGDPANGSCAFVDETGRIVDWVVTS